MEGNNINLDFFSCLQIYRSLRDLPYMYLYQYHYHSVYFVSVSPPLCVFCITTTLCVLYHHSVCFVSPLSVFCITTPCVLYHHSVCFVSPLRVFCVTTQCVLYHHSVCFVSPLLSPLIRRGAYHDMWRTFITGRGYSLVEAAC